MLAKAMIYEEDGSYKEALRELEKVRSKKETPGLDEKIERLSRRVKTGRRSWKK